MQIQMKRNNQKIYLEQYRDIYNKDIFLNKADSTFNKNDLVSFYKSIKNCTNCNLSKSRTNLGDSKGFFSNQRIHLSVKIGNSSFYY